MDVNIPTGYGIPLVDLTTDLLPARTMAAVKAALPAGAGVGAQQLTDAIQAHVDSLAPHHVYDDLQNLTLLFKNGLV